MTTAVIARRVSRPALGVSMVLAAATIFALNGTVSKLLLQGGYDAPQLTAFRAAGAFVGLLILSIVIKPGPQRLKIRRQELPKLISFGLTGFFLVPMLYFVAISRLPVGIGLLFEFTAPVFVALWVRFGEHQQVRRRLWVGLALCITGLVCVTEVWAGELSLNTIGIAAALSSAVLLAGYYVLGSKTVAERDPLSVTTWAFGVSAIAGAIVRPWWNFKPEVLAGSSGGVPMWLLAIYLLIFGTLIPYLLISASMQHLPPTSVGIIGMSELVLASVFAWVLLSEFLSTAQILGGLVLLAGVILAETARAGQTHQARHEPRPSQTPEIPPV